MHEYDKALKNLLTRGQGSLLRRLTGLEVTRWLNAELPEVRSLRADLLGEVRSGRLAHFELQSANDVRMVLRMLEYSVAIQRALGSFPEQLVLYVGEAPLRMVNRVSGPGLSYECRMVDIRELDGELLLESPSLEDNIVAILARLSDRIGTVRRILTRIAESAGTERTAAVTEFLILAGLRSLGAIVEREIEQMPILNDIMDHEVIGRERRLGVAEGERNVIMRVLADRFGQVPAWASQRIGSLAAADLDRLSARLLKAASIEELLAE